MNATFSFTKLVVHDLEKQAAFYRDVYGLHAVQRVQAEIGSEAIDEIMLSGDPNAPFGSLVLLKFLPRAAAQQGELILGFVTDDLPALLDRVRAAGGRIHAPAKEMPELKLRVAFATDPEGHMAEIVQMVSA
jgi:predicted enzyme related to lactoylglutathione lyase